MSSFLSCRYQPLIGGVSPREEHSSKCQFAPITVFMLRLQIGTAGVSAAGIGQAAVVAAPESAGRRWRCAVDAADIAVH